MSRSRLQAPVHQSGENPNLKPLPPQVDPWASRGRFQNANLVSSAEERTRVNGKNVLYQSQEKRTINGEQPGEIKTEETTTTVVEE